MKFSTEPTVRSATGRALVPPLVVIGLAVWGLLACWNATLLGWRVGAPLASILRAAFGEEGIQPGRRLIEPFFLLLAIGGVIRLLVLRRVLPRVGQSSAIPPAAMRELVLELRLATTTLIVFISLLGATLVFLALNVFGGAGSWIDDNLGAPSVGYPGVALLAFFTVLCGWAFRRVDLRLRHHPVYGKEPRTKP